MSRIEVSARPMRPGGLWWRKLRRGFIGRARSWDRGVGTGGLVARGWIEIVGAQAGVPVPPGACERVVHDGMSAMTFQRARHAVPLLWKIRGAAFSFEADPGIYGCVDEIG